LIYHIKPSSITIAELKSKRTEHTVIGAAPNFYLFTDSSSLLQWPQIHSNQRSICGTTHLFFIYLQTTLHYHLYEASDQLRILPMLHTHTPHIEKLLTADNRKPRCHTYTTVALMVKMHSWKAAHS